VVTKRRFLDRVGNGVRRIADVELGFDNEYIEAEGVPRATSSRPSSPASSSSAWGLSRTI